MTNAGWYPDPAGTPNTYRYWDGQSWSQQTSSDPFGTGQGAAAPQQPGQPGSSQPGPGQPSAPTWHNPVPPPPPAPPQQAPPPSPYQPMPYGDQPQQWSPMPGAPVPGGPGGPGGSGTGKTIAIVTGVVAVLVLLAVAAFIGVRALGGDDDSSEAKAPASATLGGSEGATSGTPDTGSAAPGTPLGTLTPTAAQCAGGTPSMSATHVGKTISQAGLTAPSLSDQGYAPSAGSAHAYTFAGRISIVSKQTGASWVSQSVVAELPKANGYSDVESAARTVMACLAENTLMYTNASSLTEVSGTAVHVGTANGYQLTSNIKVDDPSVGVSGDTVTIVVVDTGRSGDLALWLMTAPIGNTALQKLEKSTASRLQTQ